MSGGDNAVAVGFHDVWKRFGPLAANAGVSFEVREGSIHGIVGENGAGKSTAMKMLYGLYPPDGGEIRIGGAPVRLLSPRDAMRHGVGMVHQHFMLARPFSALDNIILGVEPARGSFLPRFLRRVDRGEARQRMEKIMAATGLRVPLDTAVEDLPVGLQQRLEILKLLYRDARILILDEPTAVLTPQEVDELFAMLLRLRDEGRTILLVTHKLREVLRFTDDITVLRAGKVQGSLPTREASEERLAELMVGRRVSLRVGGEAGGSPVKVGEPVLELAGITLRRRNAPRPSLDAVSFSVRGGEIVGIAGVEGNGQSEILKLVQNPKAQLRAGTGKIRICGVDAERLTTAEIRKMALALMPEDRLRDGILAKFSLAENFLLGFQDEGRFARMGFVLRRKLRAVTQETLESFDVRPRNPEAEIRTLSGGNQQKFVVGREFHHAPRLIVAAHPTRGVDVGAIEFLHRRILAARDAGAGVLLVSSELDEILSLSDRVLVLYEGRVVAEFARGQCDETTVGRFMGGGK